MMRQVLIFSLFCGILAFSKNENAEKTNIESGKDREKKRKYFPILHLVLDRK